MDYDEEPEVPCRGCVRYSETVKRLKREIKQLQTLVDEYHANGCCPDPVTGYDCKAINAERKRRAELETELEVLKGCTATIRAKPTGKEINIDGRVDSNNANIKYLGSALEMDDGTWRCCANVGGALCLVEVILTPILKEGADR